jgi:hypothetical protein
MPTAVYFGGDEVELDSATLKEQSSAPDDPASGKARLYVDDSQKLKLKDSGGDIARIGYHRTGTYTGDGNATQAITGVGFEPSHLVIRDTNGNRVERFGIGGDAAWKNNAASAAADLIVSLDADGFTVGDGDTNLLNTNSATYYWAAWG